MLLFHPLTPLLILYEVIDLVYVSLSSGALPIPLMAHDTQEGGRATFEPRRSL